MNTLAIIPARGGSKRIPRKNIRDFLGRPIIAYSIDAALQSQLFDDVMVSTDDLEIAAVAEQCGANVPFMRNKQNSNDNASTMDVIQEVLKDYYDKFGLLFQYVCCIYPTAPLIKLKHLKEGFHQLTKRGFNTVFPIVPFSYPVWRGLQVDENDKVKMVWPEYMNFRTQDLDKIYHDAGQWYWMKTSGITNRIFTDNSGTLILSEEDVQDIDTPTDWKLAEMKFKLSHEI